MALPKRLYSSYTTFILPLQTCLEYAEQAHTELKVLEANGSSPQAVLLRGLAPHLGPSRQQNGLPRHPTWAQTGCIQEQTSLGQAHSVKSNCSFRESPHWLQKHAPRSTLLACCMLIQSAKHLRRADSAGRTRLAILVCRSNLWLCSECSGIATWSAT